MLFKNLKTGNTVSTSAKDAIDLMQRSPIYEAVPEAVTAPEAPAEDAPAHETEGGGDSPAVDENTADGAPKPKSRGKKPAKADE